MTTILLSALFFAFKCITIVLAILILPFLYKMFLLYRVYWQIILYRVPPFIYFGARQQAAPKQPIGFAINSPQSEPQSTTARKKK